MVTEIGEKDMSENARNKGRMAIYTMAGFYLVYMAYTMFGSLGNSTGNEKILMVVFTIFFAVVGVAMIVFGITTGYKLSKKNPGQQTEQADDLTESPDKDE